MRKRYKIKARSCGLCKPHKRGWSHRYTPQQYAALLDFEKMKKIQETVNPNASSADIQ